MSVLRLDTFANQEITITNTNTLSEEKIKEIIEEAKKNKEKDEKFIKIQKKQTSIAQKLNMLINSFEKYKDEVSPELKNDAQSIIEESEDNLTLKILTLLSNSRN